MSKAELADERQVVEVLNQTGLRVLQPYKAPTEIKVDRVLRPEEDQGDLFHSVADVVSGVVRGVVLPSWLTVRRDLERRT